MKRISLFLFMIIIVIVGLAINGCSNSNNDNNGGPTYTLTASAGANGTISPSGATTVNSGASQSFTFTPSANYVVDTVTVDDSAVSSPSNPYTFTNVIADHTISVTFKLATYTITFDKNDAAATGSMSQQTITYGATQNLSLNAYSKTGWTFTGWATTPGGSIAYMDGAPYTMGSGNVTLYAKWSGWEQVGGSLENNPLKHLESPQITVKGTTPYVCWGENGQLYVKHFDGSSWVQDGGGLRGNADAAGASYPTIISDNTSVYVNFREVSDAAGGYGFYVLKLTPAGWEVVGNNYIFNDAASVPAQLWDTSSIAISNNGTLYFTVITGDMGENLTFYFDGSAWQLAWQNAYYVTLPWYYYGGAAYPQIVFNNNVLYIIWQDTIDPRTSLGYVGVAYYDNSDNTNPLHWVRPWDPLNYNSTYTDRYPRMAASSDSILYAAWSEYDASQNNSSVYVKKLNGSAWTLVGSAGLNVDPANSASQPDIACVGTTPYVVWSETDTDSHTMIYVKHFNGTEWVQDGPALNIGSALVQNPRIASDGTTPYVIWKEQDQSSNNHVYVKRWVK